MDVQVRIGHYDSGTNARKIALSHDSGASWSQDYECAPGVSAGVAISADADTILWHDAATNTVKFSHGTSAFTASNGVPQGAVIASDKKVKSLQ
jgi:xyloglucan-specific exo-beta-1,4-glucanase